MISQISIGQMELINVLILRDKLEILIILFLWYSFSPMKKKRSTRLPRYFIFSIPLYLIPILLFLACGPSNSIQSERTTDKPSLNRLKKSLDQDCFWIENSELIQQHPTIVPSLADTFIVIFEVKDPASPGDVDLYAQRISKKGHAIWKKARPIATAPARESSPKAIADGEGGAFVVFDAIYNKGKYRGDRDLAAQRITAKGKLLWENGKTSVIVAGSRTIEKNPVMISDGKSGLIVVFERKYLKGNNRGDLDVFSQRLSAKGKKLWGQGQASVPVSNTKHLEKNPCVIADGNNGFIVVNELEPRTGEQAGNTELVGQRLDISGQRTWLEGQRPIVVTGTNLAERNPVAISDGAGGAIVAFELHTLFGKNRGKCDIAVLRLASNGDLLWIKNSNFINLTISEKLQEHSPVVLSDGDGGAIIIFQATYPDGKRKGDKDLYAQHLSSQGKPLWNKGKRSAVVAISNKTEGKPSAFRLEKGSLLLAYEQLSPGSTKTDSDGNIVLQLLSPNGNRVKSHHLPTAGKGPGLNLKNPALAADSQDNSMIVFEVKTKKGTSPNDIDIAGKSISGKGDLLN